MNIIERTWKKVTGQFISDNDGNKWLISELIAKVKEQDLKEFDIPLQHLCISDKKIGGMPIREFVSYVRQIEECSLDDPIILDEDGAIFDGCHRVAKALIAELETIKAVRFESNPLPTIIKIT